MSKQPSTLKKPLLYSLVISVILGAVLGIVVVLRDTWGWYEVRIILTTITVAVASLCGLACELSKVSVGRDLLPKGGRILTGIAGVAILAAMWTDCETEWIWKGIAAVSIFAVATVHVCLLSIAKLTRRFQWVFFVGWQAIYGLAALLAAMVLLEIDVEGLWRFVAVLSIVNAAITLVIPILHRIGRMESNRHELLMPLEKRNVAAIAEEIERLQARIAKLEKMKAELGGNSAAPQAAEGPLSKLSQSKS